MRSTRKISQDDPTVLDPIFQPIDFSEDQAVVTMATLLRRAWLQKEPEADVNPETFSNWLVTLNGMSVAEVDENAIEETDLLHTPLRQMIIKFWKLVHCDVLEFLDEMTPYCGTMQSQSMLVVQAGDSSQSDGGRKGTAALADYALTNNILLIPAYVAPGTRIRITRDRLNPTEAEKEVEIGIFDLEKNPFEIYFLRRGFSFNFYIDGTMSGEKRETAAVFSICVLHVYEED